MGDGSVSVRVAVRVRPFNKREIEMKAKLCINMDGKQTCITQPETGKKHDFAFDYSYWSHDGFIVDAEGISVPDGPTSRYASQRIVFNDLGKDVLENCFGGFNCSLFAYGQTGSGKSYSMVGYGANKGIIPIICDEMFKKIEACKSDKNLLNTRYQVTVTMLEIYNEQIRDLLNIKINPPGGLKLRNNPKTGTYVEKLTPLPVGSYDAINKAMETGSENRTVGSTNMNQTSSRAHTVFGILFTTIVKDTGTGKENESTSKVNLVDLAGSERAESTGATGDRLKEGCAINQSLSSLGNVISALADIASGKKKVFVPYRNSVLTRLLQDALGGNSKTVMIAALSPADVNYDETLSTLRYADRAKKIKNQVTKNENPTERIIRMLREENEKLRKMLEGKLPAGGLDALGGEGGGGGGSGGGDEKWKEEYEAMTKAKMAEQMAENQRMLDEMKKSWEEKMKEATLTRADDGDAGGALMRRQAGQVKLPHMVNLHEDPQLSELMLYVFKLGVTKIGTKQSEEKQDIVLSGLNIKKQHAIVENKEGVVSIEPLQKSKTFVNGELVTKRTELKAGDRLILGNNLVFRFQLPAEEGKEVKEEDHSADWQKAMDEFTEKQGLRLQNSTDMAKLEEEEKAKRKEMEEKLAKMEEELKRQKDIAKAQLEQEKARFSHKAVLTDEDKQMLAKFEAEFATKESSMGAEAQKRREEAKMVLAQQMAKKREMKRFEEQLGQLIPLVLEANNMAEELSKPVRFEARIRQKPTTAVMTNTNEGGSLADDLQQLSTVEIIVRVMSQTSGNVWIWSLPKFESRFFIMREHLQHFMEYGPREIANKDDPFWDPPEAVEIGKAYVYLKALSQLVEIENEFSIINYAGDEQGVLAVEIFPETKDGDDLQYLDNPDELLGQQVTFVVRIDYAKGLPKKYCNDVHVVYSFFESDKLETDVCEQKTTDPKFKYEAKFTFEKATEKLRDYLLTQAAVFEVRGFSDIQVPATTAAQPAKAMALPAPSTTPTPATQAAARPSVTAAASAPAQLCQQCEEKPAEFQCMECARAFCTACFGTLHKSAAKRQHQKKPLAAAEAASGSATPLTTPPSLLSSSSTSSLTASSAIAESSRKQESAAPANTSSMCDQCEEQAATIQCVDCGKAFCAKCNEILHKSARKKDHVRQPFGAAAVARSPTVEEAGASAVPLSASSSSAGSGAAPAAAAERKCAHCEERSAVVRCAECTKDLCDTCNNVLHKSAAKKAHNRTPI